MLYTVFQWFVSISAQLFEVFLYDRLKPTSFLSEASVLLISWYSLPTEKFATSPSAISSLHQWLCRLLVSTCCLSMAAFHTFIMHLCYHFRSFSWQLWPPQEELYERMPLQMISWTYLHFWLPIRGRTSPVTCYSETSAIELQPVPGKLGAFSLFANTRSSSTGASSRTRS